MARPLWLWRMVIVGVPSLIGSTLVVAILQDRLHVPNPSAVYLVAVVATAYVSGTPGAVVSSLLAFLLYDYLFIEPRYTLTIAQPGEWLGVLLLLFVGVTVGQLAAHLRQRARQAQEREREAVALFRLSHALATRESTPPALAEIARILLDETRMARLWITLGTDEATERVAADTGDGSRAAVAGLQHVLRRMPGDIPAQWIRIHRPTGRSRSPASPAEPATALEPYRIRIEASGAALGSIWALRSRALGDPGRSETRLLAAAADQIGQALGHDRMIAERQAAEIARQSDAVKSSLLQSVSHDLRTPLATIRAAAGSLRPGSGLTEAEQRESAEAIDREVEYLNRLVTNLLDLSRIEAGALRAERDVFELDDLIQRSMDRLRRRLDGRQVEVDVADQPVEVDPVFLDEAFTNVMENALKYTPAGTRLRVASASVDGAVRLTIEDAGPGVPDETLERLFEKFYRVPQARRQSRAGTGIGLAVVRGLVEAMGGTVHARRSDLGGLAIDLDLPAADVPPGLAATA